jgi:hypothetical protein
MSDQPASSNTDRARPTTGQSSLLDNQPDLFDLAAQLAGRDPIDIVKVRRGDGDSLVVILITGQKFTFSASALGPEIDQAVRAQLAAVLGQQPPAQAKTDKPPKLKKAA